MTLDRYPNKSSITFQAWIAILLCTSRGVHSIDWLLPSTYLVEDGREEEKEVTNKYSSVKCMSRVAPFPPNSISVTPSISLLA